MTYNDIYTKFMIEYDKANVTSSYPSLTKYEAATILDKAYLALIGLKVSGNNVRKSGIETDIKSISDLQLLTVSANITNEDGRYVPENEAALKNVSAQELPEDFLYIVEAYVLDPIPEGVYPMSISQSTSLGWRLTYTPMQVITHNAAKKFFVTKSNLPWIKIPVCYIENGMLFIVYDPINVPSIANGVYIIYIKQPSSFVKNINAFLSTTFLCSDSMAEELVSLAVVFALENVESTRLNSKLNTRGLEA